MGVEKLRMEEEEHLNLFPSDGFSAKNNTQLHFTLHGKKIFIIFTSPFQMSQSQLKAAYNGKISEYKVKKAFSVSSLSSEDGWATRKEEGLAHSWLSSRPMKRPPIGSQISKFETRLRAPF